MVGAYDEALRAYGVTVAKLDLLMFVLTADDDVRPIDSAQSLHMDPSTLSRNLKWLETRRLVEQALASGSAFSPR